MKKLSDALREVIATATDPADLRQKVVTTAAGYGAEGRRVIEKAASVTDDAELATRLRGHFKAQPGGYSAGQPDPGAPGLPSMGQAFPGAVEAAQSAAPKLASQGRTAAQIGLPIGLAVAGSMAAPQLAGRFAPALARAASIPLQEAIGGYLGQKGGELLTGAPQTLKGNAMDVAMWGMTPGLNRLLPNLTPHVRGLVEGALSGGLAKGAGAGTIGTAVAGGAGALQGETAAHRLALNAGVQGQVREILRKLPGGEKLLDDFGLKLLLGSPKQKVMARDMGGFQSGRDLLGESQQQLSASLRQAMGDVTPPSSVAGEQAALSMQGRVGSQQGVIRKAVDDAMAQFVSLGDVTPEEARSAADLLEAQFVRQGIAPEQVTQLLSTMSGGRGAIPPGQAAADAQQTLMDPLRTWDKALQDEYGKALKGVSAEPLSPEVRQRLSSVVGGLDPALVSEIPALLPPGSGRAKTIQRGVLGLSGGDPAALQAQADAASTALERAMMYGDEASAATARAQLEAATDALEGLKTSYRSYAEMVPDLNAILRSGGGSREVRGFLSKIRNALKDVAEVGGMDYGVSTRYAKQANSQEALAKIVNKRREFGVGKAWPAVESMTTPRSPQADALDEMVRQGALPAEAAAQLKRVVQSGVVGGKLGGSSPSIEALVALRSHPSMADPAVQSAVEQAIAALESAKATRSPLAGATANIGEALFPPTRGAGNIEQSARMSQAGDLTAAIEALPPREAAINRARAVQNVRAAGPLEEFSTRLSGNPAALQGSPGGQELLQASTNAGQALPTLNRVGDALEGSAPSIAKRLLSPGTVPAQVREIVHALGGREGVGLRRLMRGAIMEPGSESYRNLDFSADPQAATETVLRMLLGGKQSRLVQDMARLGEAMPNLMSDAAQTKDALRVIRPLFSAGSFGGQVTGTGPMGMLLAVLGMLPEAGAPYFSATRGASKAASTLSGGLSALRREAAPR